MRDDRGDEEVDRVFDYPFGDFRPVPWGAVELAPGSRIPVDPAFDATVDVLEEESVRAGSATPEAPEERGDEKQREPETADEKEPEPKVTG